jgi:flagellar motor component MotA
MKQLIQFMEKAAALSQKSRKKGLLSLEDDINNIDDSKENSRNIFKLGMKLALDGTNPAFINMILSNIIESEQDREEKRLKEIQKEAVLMIQAGYNTRMFAINLLSLVEKNEQRAIEKADLKDYLNWDNGEPSEPMTQNEFFSQTAQIISTTYNFSLKARREGLLALEDDLEDLNDEYLKKGLHLAVDGTDSKIINFVLSNIINIEKNDTRRRLQTITKEAVLNIQEGCNDQLMVHKLISYLNNTELKNIAGLLSDIDYLKEFDLNDCLPAGEDAQKFTENAAHIIHRALNFGNDIDRQKWARRDIFEYGMQFAASGINPDDIDYILSNLIKHEQGEEAKRLKTMQKEAVLGISKNENPSLLLCAITSHINDNELEEVKKIISKTGFNAKFTKMLENPAAGTQKTANLQKLFAKEMENNAGSREVIDFFSRLSDKN